VSVTRQAAVRTADRSSVFDAVRLTIVASQGEADVICSLLHAHGIECAERLVESVDSARFWREVLVRPSDLAAARDLLAAASD
jgi:hypothetical protein